MSEEENYIIENETTDISKKQEYWNTGIGLNKVDNLEPSKYLLDLSQKNINGELKYYEVENLLDIARIKCLAREKSILKIAQKRENIIFYFDNTRFNFEVVDKLMKQYRNRIKFSPSKDPYITFKLADQKMILEECKEFLSKL